MSSDSLDAFIQKYRNKKIVFAYGDFDVFNATHLKYLCGAAAKGDLLAVGVLDDESAQKLKGDKGFFVQSSDRLKTVSAMEPVDFAFVYRSDEFDEIARKIGAENVIAPSTIR